MWGYVGFEAAIALHDLTTPPLQQQAPLRHRTLKGILRVTTAALVAQEQGTRRSRRARRQVMRELPPLRATPVGAVGVQGKGEKNGGTADISVARRRRSWGRSNWGKARTMKTLGARGASATKASNRTTMTTTAGTVIRVGAAVRPSSRPPGPIKGSGSSVEKSVLG